MCNAGRKLQADKHPRSAEIQQRAESLLAHWKLLHELVDLRKKQLDDAAEAYQVSVIFGLTRKVFQIWIRVV